MIQSITLKKFKLFEDVKIPLSNINLLTGINGRGKSTVLQSLLLMKQSPELDKTIDKIIFNGTCVDLGNIKDIKNVRSRPKDNIEFSFHYKEEDKEVEITYHFNADKDDSLDASIMEIEIKNNITREVVLAEKTDVGFNIHKGYQELFLPSLFELFLNIEDQDIKEIKEIFNLSKIHYISADRIGPKSFYKKNSITGFASVGARGENTINVLWQKRNDPVYENLCSKDITIPHTVLNQLEFWLSEIFDGAKTKLDEIPLTDLLSFRLSTNNTTDYFLPTNVGFGYSYVLPILVAGLIAKGGEIMIVENPEAHLHPYAQSVLSEFLSLISENNVQIIIESHSDHILNGLRICVKDEILEHYELNLLYFDQNLPYYFQKIDVDQDGGIDEWPEDFFDQGTKDLNYLLGL